MSVDREIFMLDEGQIADSISRPDKQVKNIEARCGQSLRTLLLRAEILRLQGLLASCRA